MFVSSHTGNLIDPEKLVTVTFVHKKRRRWPKWIGTDGVFLMFEASRIDKETIIRTYRLRWNAN